ncbi:iron-sulfur cluster assembly scaffold protein [Patescibacteria group bacterium]
MNMYRQIILDHYKNPRNFGNLDKPDSKAVENNTSCGDRIIIEILVDEKAQKVSEIRFSGEGCAISQAAASMLTEKVKDMEYKKIMSITGKDVVDMLGTTLTPSRVKCATLCLEVLHKAVGKVSSYK